MSTCSLLCFFFSRFGYPRDLHSFPTRRSSDLLRVRFSSIDCPACWAASCRLAISCSISRVDCWVRWARPRTSSATTAKPRPRSEEHTSELQSRPHLVCRLLLEKKKEANLTHPP